MSLAASKLTRATWAATRTQRIWCGNQLAALPPKALEGSPFWSVVAFAGEDLQVVLGRFHFDFAEFSVLGRVARIVAQGILAAEFLGNLVKGFRELLFRPNRNHAPAGLLRQFVRHARVAAKSRVHDEQDVNH